MNGGYGYTFCNSGNKRRNMFIQSPKLNHHSFGQSDTLKAPLWGPLKLLYTKYTTFPLVSLKGTTSYHTFYINITYLPSHKYNWYWSLVAAAEYCFADFWLLCCTFNRVISVLVSFKFLMLYSKWILLSWKKWGESSDCVSESSGAFRMKQVFKIFQSSTYKVPASYRANIFWEDRSWSSWPTYQWLSFRMPTFWNV